MSGTDSIGSRAADGSLGGAASQSLGDADSARLPDGRRANVDPAVRRRMIAEAAYHRAANRGFYPGAEVEDWLAAERDVDGFLAAGEGAPPV